MSSFSESTESSSSDCPYWKRGYCVADKACKLSHDPTRGGQLQESYLSQINIENNRQPLRPAQPVMVPQPYNFSASAMASAVYGGAQPVLYGYGYYGQGAVIPIVIGQPSASQMPPKNYKTVPCRHFMRGHCIRGDTCGFRHTEEESSNVMSLPVTSAYGQLPAELANPVHPGRPFRVLTCRRWLQGSCALGDRCTYRHDLDAVQPSTISPNSGVKRSLSPDRSANETADTSANKDDLEAAEHDLKVQKTI